jgi:AraC-like DNA-binding protein
MRYLEHAPAPDLLAWVDRYWSLEDFAPAAQPAPVLPDGRPEWVIHLGQPFAGQGSCLAIGQMTGPVYLNANGPLRAFGIRFRPEGAYAFTRCNQSGLTNRILDLTGIAPRWRDEAGNGDPVRATDKMLRALQPRAIPRVSHGVGLLLAGMAVDAVARECNWSPRHLERVILYCTGLAPKMLSRLARFQRSLRLRDAGREWASVAAEAGYADQSHLIRDFRRFAGCSPASLESSALTQALVR